MKFSLSALRSCVLPKLSEVKKLAGLPYMSSGCAILLLSDYGIPTFDMESIERGPRFVLEPKDLIYDNNPDPYLGQIVVLNNIIYDSTQASFRKYAVFTCEADGNPYPSYAWYRERTSERILLDPMEFERYTVSNGRLLIHEPKDAEDNGDYQCNATNKFGSVLSQKATLRFGCKYNMLEYTAELVLRNTLEIRRMRIRPLVVQTIHCAPNFV